MARLLVPTFTLQLVRPLQQQGVGVVLIEGRQQIKSMTTALLGGLLVFEC